jgi:hypothetical protein
MNEAVQKDLFNRRACKEGAEFTKINNSNSILCDLSEKPFCSSRLNYFNFLDTF